MGRMRSEMSKKNKYYIDPERYLELKHFCLQYKKMKEEWSNAELFGGKAFIFVRDEKNMKGSIVETTAEHCEDIFNRFHMIDECAMSACFDIWTWLVKGVSEGLSYDKLKARGIPCSKDYYYDAYHKFFYILDKERK